MNALRHCHSTHKLDPISMLQQGCNTVCKALNAKFPLLWCLPRCASRCGAGLLEPIFVFLQNLIGSITNVRRKAWLSLNFRRLGIWLSLWKLEHCSLENFVSCDYPNLPFAPNIQVLIFSALQIVRFELCKLCLPQIKKRPSHHQKELDIIGLSLLTKLQVPSRRIIYGAFLMLVNQRKVKEQLFFSH